MFARLKKEKGYSLPLLTFKAKFAEMKQQSSLKNDG
jgi:hypothetical protein